jgi:predicted NAD/FAD-binding protein
MSFSVHNEATGLEYNAATLASLFCQHKNLVSPRFLGMIRDLIRFYREASALLDLEHRGPTLGEYLETGRYGAAFRDEHLVPMASALWSAPPKEILSFPAQYLVRFMANHQMLKVQRRPVWHVVAGGSDTYVAALRARWSVEERISCPVRRVVRDARSVKIATDRGVEAFDQVVFACHSDQALSLLGDASPTEREVLGAMRYQVNEAALHTDATMLPRNPRAWAAWNALIPRVSTETCTVSYFMNLLQGIDSPEPLIVSLNPTRLIEPRLVLKKLRYHHPIYSHESVAAQGRKHEIQGKHRSWFAGAYWGWGFHEDGVRSAVEVAAALDAPWRTQAAGESVTPVPTRELAA